MVTPVRGAVVRGVHRCECVVSCVAWPVARPWMNQAIFIANTY
jgi:hypothetical protein